MIRARLIALTVMAASASAGLASAESLSDAIALAYQTNPALLAARADLRQLDERYIQARGALGPTASISDQHSKEAADVKQPNFSTFPPTPKTRYRAETDSAQLTVNQPLYQGGALATAINVARAEVLTGRQSLRQTETGVIGQVITAYVDVLLAQDLVTISRQNVEILRRQMDETQAKVDVKEVTLTDKAQTSARLIAAQVQLTQAQGQLENAQAKYRASVGQAPGQLEPAPDLPGLPPNRGDALDAADRANPQLLEAVYTELASRGRIAQAKAADGLRVGLSADVTSEPLVPYQEHQSINAVVGSVTVSKTLFTSGIHGSQIREAIEADNRDDLKAADIRRQVISAVIQTWNDLSAQRQVLVALNDQIGQENKAFEGSRIEARIGLRTTIDVLNAEQEFQATKVTLARTYHDEYLSRVTLLAHMGLLQAEFLDPTIDPYRPEQSLARRDYWTRVLPWEALVAGLDSIGAPAEPRRAPDRDPLGADRPTGAEPLPATPKWSDFAQYLTDQPAK